MAERERKTPAGLPTFEFEPAVDDPAETDHGSLDWYTCPRVNCRGTFAVYPGELVETVRRRSTTTAPCPHCFRVSHVPGTGDVQEELGT